MPHTVTHTQPHRHVHPPIYTHSDSHLVTPFVVPATIKSETAEKNPKKKAAKPPNEKLQKITFAGVFIAASIGITRGVEGSLLDAGVRDTEHQQGSRIGAGEEQESASYSNKCYAANCTRRLVLQYITTCRCTLRPLTSSGGGAGGKFESTPRVRVHLKLAAWPPPSVFCPGVDLAHILA